MTQALEVLECLRCGTGYDDSWMFEGCPLRCKAGINVNLSAVVELPDALQIDHSLGADKDERGLWRYRELLPVGPDHTTTLGEGLTPLLKLEVLGENIGFEHLYLKDEGRNPTWSYKDRFCSVAISKGRELGAKVVTISTSGNHGASTAAYAAKANLPCVIFTTPEIPDTMKTLMQVYGALVVVVPTPRDRWTLMRQCVEQFQWYPTSGYLYPPIGSNPWGIEGYKTIACEIVEQLDGQAPNWVIVPTAYGDGLYGIWKGFKELKALAVIDRLPKMLAAERFGSLAHALAEGLDRVVEVPASSSVAFSIATARTSTYQCCLTESFERVPGNSGHGLR